MTIEVKKSINNLLGFSYKMGLLLITGYISSNYLRLDLINYKKNTFTQFLIFMLIEENINSYFPKWVKGSKEAKYTRAKKLTFSYPIDVEPGKTLNPDHHEL